MAKSNLYDVLDQFALLIVCVIVRVCKMEGLSMTEDRQSGAWRVSSSIHCVTALLIPKK